MTKGLLQYSSINIRGDAIHQALMVDSNVLPKDLVDLIKIYSLPSTLVVLYALNSDFSFHVEAAYTRVYMIQLRVTGDDDCVEIYDHLSEGSFSIHTDLENVNDLKSYVRSPSAAVSMVFTSDYKTSKKMFPPNMEYSYHTHRSPRIDAFLPPKDDVMKHLKPIVNVHPYPFIYESHTYPRPAEAELLSVEHSRIKSFIYCRQ